MTGRPRLYEEPMSQIQISIPLKIRAWLDDIRGGASRSHVIRQLLELAMVAEQEEERK